MPKSRSFSRAHKEQQAVDITRRLTARDRAIVEAIYDHKVLTTEHLKILFFRSIRRCQDRLKQLAGMGLIERWHPPQAWGRGKSQGLWFLREQGARVVAAVKGVPRSSLPWMPRETLVNDSHLPHRLAVNAFFCTLVEASLAHDGHGLHVWEPERTVRTDGGWIRPDGFGRYVHPVGSRDFWLEYDRGTETVKQLVPKLAGYLAVARDRRKERSGAFPILLIVVPTPTRERVVARAYQEALRRFRPDGHGRLRIFVASEELLYERGILGQVWAPILQQEIRLSLVDLPARTSPGYSLSKSLGRYWTEEVEDRGSRILPFVNRPRFPIGAPPMDDREHFQGTAGPSVTGDAYGDPRSAEDVHGES